MILMKTGNNLNITIRGSVRPAASPVEGVRPAWLVGAVVGRPVVGDGNDVDVYAHEFGTTIRTADSGNSSSRRATTCQPASVSR